MWDEFLIRALLAGLGVALLAGPLGCFVVWRRMAYFGAAISHAALLGVAIGLLFQVDIRWGLLTVAVGIATGLGFLQRFHTLPADTLLGILAHGALALGITVLAFFEPTRVNLLNYLVGDILAVSWGDVVWIWLGTAAGLIGLALIWRPLLISTVSDELARTIGVRVELVRWVFLVLMSVVIAAAMQVVGILLIVSLLVIPAAAARRLAVTPEQMAIGGALIGGLAVVFGLAASLGWNTPAGPSIVVCATVIFVGSLLAPVRTAT